MFLYQPKIPAKKDPKSGALRQNKTHISHGSLNDSYSPKND